MKGMISCALRKSCLFRQRAWQKEALGVFAVVFVWLGFVCFFVVLLFVLIEGFCSRMRVGKEHPRLLGMAWRPPNSVECWTVLDMELEPSPSMEGLEY